MFLIKNIYPGIKPHEKQSKKHPQFCISEIAEAAAAVPAQMEWHKRRLTHGVRQVAPMVT